MHKRVGVVLILLFAFFGIADSAYLAQHELSGAPLICNIEYLSGCNVVAQSPYSHLLGIPLAEYGILFYAIVFVLAALELVIFDRILRRALQGLAAIGVLASICFTLLQVLVIGALCIYCLTSAIIALLIFVFATFIEPLRALEKSAPPVHEPARSTPPPFRMPPSA